MILYREKDMYSFGVYDTVITRSVMHPQAIFLCMRHKMLLHREDFDFSMEYILDFENIRVNAEKQARRVSDNEVTLEKIYKVLSDNYNISPVTRDKLIRLEIECEIENTIIISETVKKIQTLVNTGEKVILISDTYLPKDFFVMLFDRICPFLNELTLYVSCEEGKTKNSGLLYDCVKQKENIEYSDWTHEGDNITSDINIPKLFGIKTVQYNIKTNKYAIERLENIRIEHKLLLEYMQGMLKNIGEREDSNSYIIGYGFIGVILYSYVNWIINNALNKKIEDLYFIARDGYILKQIAEKIIHENNISLKTHYLYGSRKAWRVEDEKNKNMLLEYLNQEIRKGHRFALVDTQGTGLSIDYLSKIYGERITVFYYTLFENSDDKFINAYSYSPYAGKGIIEAFCRAPHGSTKYYEKVNNCIKPVIEEIDLNLWVESGLDKYMKGVVDFSENFARINKKFENSLPINLMAEKILFYCYETPDVQLADFIGDIPHDINNEDESYRYAPLLSDKEIYKIEVERTTEPLKKFYKGSELEYSYKRLTAEQLDKLKIYRRKYFDDFCKKNVDAINVVIYGYGLYGKELYHRLFKLKNINIIGVVDANNQKYINEFINISPVDELKNLKYEYIIISLHDKKIAVEIKKMLIASGIEEDKIIFGNEFVDLYINQ